MAQHQLVGRNDQGYRIGRWHHRCTVPDEIVLAIRDMHEHPEQPIGSNRIGYRRLAAHFGLSVYTVRRICDYSMRGQVPTQWTRE